jgi:phenylpyruvate tautomerase PptA (4-oxalocrotonate tautomerase family)
MPHIRVRGMRREQVQEFSLGLAQELAPILSTSPDNFTIEWIGSEFFENGKPSPGYPFIEVLWFARSDAVKTKCAEAITARTKKIAPDNDIAVVFQAIEKSDYFENGQSF